MVTHHWWASLAGRFVCAMARSKDSIRRVIPRERCEGRRMKKNATAFGAEFVVDFGWRIANFFSFVPQRHRNRYPR